MTTKLSPMQEQLLQRADSIFASISTTVAKATDFASEQIPDIAIQYVAFGRAYSTTLVVVSTLIMLAYVFMVYKFIKHDVYNSSLSRFSESSIAVTVVGAFPSVGALITVMVNVKDVFLVWFAPKIWLITEIAKLVK